MGDCGFVQAVLVRGHSRDPPGIAMAFKRDAV